MTDVVGDRAGDVDRLPILDGADELGDDRGSRSGDDACSDCRPVDALESPQKCANVLVVSIRPQDVHRCRLPIGGIVEAKKLQVGGGRVSGEWSECGQCVGSSVGNQNLVDELLPALCCEEGGEHLLGKAID